MQKIALMILFPLSVLAIEPTAQECAEFERQCFMAVCETPAENSFPSSVGELETALSRQNYVLPARFASELNSFTQKLAAMNTRNRGIARTKGFPQIATEVLAKPMTYVQDMLALLEGKVSIGVNSAGQLAGIVTDMSSDRAVYDRLKTMLLDVGSLSRAFENPSEVLSTPGALSFYQGLFYQMESAATDPAKKNRIQNARMQLNASTLRSSVTNMNQLFTAQEFESMLSKRAVPYQNDLVRAFTIQATESTDRTSASPNARVIKESITRSCGLANFMMSKVRGTNPEAQFEAAKTQALAGLQREILPRLSSHTRAFIQNALAENPFEAIDFDRNIYPDLNAQSAQMRSLSSSNETEQFMNQFSFFKDSFRLTCRVDSFLPRDQYAVGEKISTSLFTIAQGYNDVLAHELGHWLSMKMQSQGVSDGSRVTFENLRNCIGGFYQNRGRPTYNSRFRADGFRTEEDFADWLGAKISVVRTHAFCGMNDIVPTVMNFLNNRSDESESAYLGHNDDNHSGNLFRVLHQKMVRGESMPPSCTALMNARPEAAPKKCEI